MRYRIACGVVLALAIAVHARAAEILVDNLHGDDAHTGRAAEPGNATTGPVRSLTRALELAQLGDQIVMTDTGVPYRESVTIFGGRHSGTELRPFVIRGNGAVLEGSLPVPKRGWEHVREDIFRFRPPRSAFAQLFLDGPPAVERHVNFATGRLPRLEPREWCLADGWIYFRVDPTKLPDEYDLTYAAMPVGVTLYQVHDVVIENLTVQGYQLDGLNAHDCVRNCQLVGVISRGNGRVGVAVGGASSVQLKDCLLSDNGLVQLLTDGPSVTALEHCELDDANAPRLLQKGGKLFFEGQPTTVPPAKELPTAADAQELP